MPEIKRWKLTETREIFVTAPTISAALEVGAKGLEQNSEFEIDLDNRVTRGPILINMNIELTNSV